MNFVYWQAIHEDLVKGFKHCMQKRIQLSQAKVSCLIDVHYVWLWFQCVDSFYL